MNLIMEQFVRAFPVASFAVLYATRNESEGFDALACAAFSMVLVVASPLSMSRYLMGAIWGGLMLLMVPSLRTRKGLFPILFLVAFLVGFPAANAFRRSSVSLERLVSALQQSISSVSTGLNTGDYDAYSMLARTAAYVHEEGVTWGHQLITVALFFVPRALWPGKGLGSGHTVAAAQGQAFTNVSCPLPAEGIINFGTFGLVLFAITLAFLAHELDSWAWTDSDGFPLYPFVCMYLFFIMRGDLLSSFAYMCGFVVSYLLACSIVHGVAITDSAQMSATR